MSYILKFIIIFLVFISFSFCWEYNFYHRPFLGVVKVEEGKKYGYKYLFYEGLIKDFDFRYVDYSDILRKLDRIRYLTFFRYSYFSKGTFSQFKDKNFDFSYLDGKELKYPILIWGVNNTLIVVVPEILIENSDKIGNKYFGDSFRIVKYKNFFIFIKNKVHFDNTFDIRRYIGVFSSLNKFKGRLITFQIGQDPFNNIKINGFSNYILWVELVNNKKLYGVIIDLFENYPLFDYSEAFYKDCQMASKIVRLFDKIVAFYKMMGAVPQDLGSLFPNYLDILSFNPFGYKLKYKALGLRSVQICFKPKSEEFKNIYWFELNNGYRCYTFSF